MNLTGSGLTAPDGSAPAARVKFGLEVCKKNPPPLLFHQLIYSRQHRVHAVTFISALPLFGRGWVQCLTVLLQCWTWWQTQAQAQAQVQCPNVLWLARQQVLHLAQRVL